MLEWILLAAAVAATAPLRLSIRVDINRKPTFEAVLHIYGLRLQFDGLLTDKGKLSMRRAGGKNEMQLPFRQLFSFWYHLFLCAQWTHAEFTGRIGTGDACTTALASAALGAALRAMGSSVRATVDVKPDFTKTFFALSARCILSFRGGDIIRAGAKVFTNAPPMKMKAGKADGAATH